MFKQKIGIFGIPILYNIFEEIKDNLPFGVDNFKKKDNLIEYLSENKINNKSFIIISDLNNKNFFLNNKILNFKNIFYLSKKKDNINSHNIFQYPIDIYSLIEKINIELIKIKYDFQSKIKVRDYLLDLNSRIISNTEKKLKLTEREMDIILFLNENKNPKKIHELQSIVWGYSSKLETHTVETHIYRLRKKIFDSFNDKKFIISTDSGYII